MRLTKLNLRNFRGFANVEQSIDLDHNIVLLHGRNASGKTSIFDAIELLLTGSIRRLHHVSDLPEVLINARTPEVPARLALELLSGRRSQVAEAIIENSKAPIVNGALPRVESELFLHAAYLQQADIRRLVTSDSAGLGDVIRALALDDSVFKLEDALAEAGITRSARNYAAVTRKLDGLVQESAVLQQQVAATRSTIANIESTDPQQDVWKSSLQQIAAKLSIVVDTDNAGTIQGAIEKIDLKVQERLRLAIEDRRSAEDLLRRCAASVARKKEIDNSGRLMQSLGAQKNEAEQKLSQIDTRIVDLHQQLRKPEFGAGITETRLALIGALERIQSIPNLDMCPVCDRPFANLRDHIFDKISTQRAEQSLTEQSVRKLQADLEAQSIERRAMTRNIDELDRNIRNLKADASAFDEEMSELLAQFRTGPEHETSLESIEQFTKNREQLAIGQIEELTLVTTEIGRIRSSISASRIRSAELRKQISSAQDRLSKVSAKLERARAAHKRLDAFVETAEEVRRRLSSGINDVIQEFVMGRTKDAFEDLFRRLAKNPFFQVTVSGAKVRRHKPEVDWCAVYGEREFPGEAVFSQGELNCCAIAFFLALATSHPEGLHFLLLDDPVQNMDELHIEEFGNVLKFLKDILGWQIVVGLHDQSVYQFLKRQLHPSTQGQSLIGYVFDQGDDGSRILKDMSTRFDPASLIAEVA